MIKNIHGSAWVSLIDKDRIELHSHSYPMVRVYRLEGGKIVYGEKKDEGGALSSEVVLARNIESPRLFEVAGHTKTGGRRTLVKISFRNRLYPKEAAYAAAGTRETWNAEYVGENAGYADGTRIFPYSSLDRAISSAGIMRPWRLYNLIVILTGNHVIEGATQIKDSVSIVFGRETSLTLQPGSRLTLGAGDRLTIGGRFYCRGTVNGVSRRIICRSDDEKLSQPLTQGLYGPAIYGRKLYESELLVTEWSERD